MTDGDGKYLTHFTKPEKKDEEPEEKQWDDEELLANLDKLPAEKVADLIVEWLKNYDVDKTLAKIGGDSTNSNTGWKGGIITWIEKKIGRKLHWIICQVHTNELGLRELIKKTDGDTDSKTGFKGPLGKMLKKVNDMKVASSFPAVSIGPDLISLPPDIVKNLSSDANLSYLRCHAVRSGVLPRDVALRKTGKIVHCRWLTTGSTFLDMYMKEHSLEGELLDRLNTIVIYLVTVYFPMFFRIKVMHSDLEGPRHVLYELQLFRLQSTDIQKLLEATLRRSAWNAHSESLLITMVCSDNKEEREFAVNKILAIRDGREEGDLKPRGRKNPELNLKATSLQDLISWTAAKEPVETCKLAILQLQELKLAPLKVEYAPVHTQGIERAVKEVTEASNSVYGFETRDGFIRARAENRELMPIFSTKKDLFSIV